MYEDLKDEFMNLFKLFRKMKEIFPKNEDLTFVEATILHQIYCISKDESVGEVTVSNLKSFFGVTNPAISQSLNTLENKDYIARTISAGDRRSVALTITDKGRDVLNENIEQTSAFMEQLIDRFGPDNMRKLIDLFTQMTTIVIDMKHHTLIEKREPL